MPSAGGDRRGSRDTRAGPGPCQDVPAASLTCPAPSPAPVPPGAMGGCFSKPKPGECPPTLGPRPAGPGREVGQQWMLAGGMLMLGSCREDYRALNPPPNSSVLSLPGRELWGGCRSARGVGGGWEGSSAWSHLLVLHHPPASAFLPDLGQSCPPCAPVWVWVTAVPAQAHGAPAPSFCHSFVTHWPALILFPAGRE